MVQFEKAIDGDRWLSQVPNSYYLFCVHCVKISGAKGALNGNYGGLVNRKWFHDKFSQCQKQKTTFPELFVKI